MSSIRIDKVIDISLPLSDSLPVWPGCQRFQVVPRLSIQNGDLTNDSNLVMNVHTGTHIDAPAHFFAHGASVEMIALATMVGTAYVADLQTIDRITATDLEQLHLPPNVTRLLCKTRNSALWQRGESEFDPDFVALTADAAQWVVDQGITLIGVDYLSVQRFDDGPETHRILLEKPVVIVEGLNLAEVTPGWYTLICLPLKLIGAEGAPVRAILFPLEV